MEDAHSVAVNLTLQKWCDDDELEDSNYLLKNKRYRKSPIFTTSNSCYLVEEENGVYLNPEMKSSRLTFYSYMLREYKYYFKYVKDSKWLGRRGYKPIALNEAIDKYLEPY